MEEHHPVVSDRTLAVVWASLIALTGITVYVAGLHLGSFSTVTALAIASFKAGLVLWYFMHLKGESTLFKVLLLVPIATLSVILVLTFIDFWYR